MKKYYILTLEFKASARHNFYMSCYIFPNINQLLERIPWAGDNNYANAVITFAMQLTEIDFNNYIGTKLTFD